MGIWNEKLRFFFLEPGPSFFFSNFFLYIVQMEEGLLRFEEVYFILIFFK